MHLICPLCLVLKVCKIMVMKLLFFFLKDMKQSRVSETTSCDLRVDNELFERWIL